MTLNLKLLNFCSSIVKHSTSPKICSTPYGFAGSIRFLSTEVRQSFLIFLFHFSTNRIVRFFNRRKVQQKKTIDLHCRMEFSTKNNVNFTKSTDLS